MAIDPSKAAELLAWMDEVAPTEPAPRPVEAAPPPWTAELDDRPRSHQAPPPRRLPGRRPRSSPPSRAELEDFSSGLAYCGPFGARWALVVLTQDHSEVLIVRELPSGEHLRLVAN